MHQLPIGIPPIPGMGQVEVVGPLQGVAGQHTLNVNIHRHHPKTFMNNGSSQAQIKENPSSLEKSKKIKNLINVRWALCLCQLLSTETNT